MGLADLRRCDMDAPKASCERCRNNLPYIWCVASTGRRLSRVLKGVTTILDIEPLDPATWFARVERLLDTTERMDGGSPDFAIRKAYHLVNLAPGPLRTLLPAQIDEQAMERMLDCGGYETAVMALIGPTTSFAAEKKAGEGTVTVEMTLQPHSINGRGHHESCAKAMLNAWAECLVNLGKAAERLSLFHPDLHKSRSGQHRRSTSH